MLVFLPVECPYCHSTDVAFRTAISYRFARWLPDNAEVFAAYKASLGLIWA